MILNAYHVAMKDTHTILDAALTAIQYIKTKHNLDEQQYKALVCVLKNPACGLDTIALYCGAPTTQVKGSINVLYVFSLIVLISADSYTISSKGKFILDDISLYFRTCLD